MERSRLTVLREQTRDRGAEKMEAGCGARGGALCRRVGVQTPWLRGLSQGLDCTSSGRDFAKPDSCWKEVCPGRFLYPRKIPCF